MDIRKSVSTPLLTFCFLCCLVSVARAQTAGTGTVTISGFEQSKYVAPPGCRAKSCATLVYDNGTVHVTVNGFTGTASYAKGSNSGSIATALGTAFNSASGSPVSASVSGSVITLVANITGSVTNFPLSTSVNFDSTDFSNPSFTATPSGSNLTGGSGPSPTVTDISPFGGVPGTSVTITGSDFGTNQGTVAFNGTAATITVWGASSVTATVPSSATTGKVTVEVSSVATTSPCPYTVTPAISAISPQSGYPQSQVTISGQFASLVASGITPGVLIGGATAQIVSMNQTTIVAVVPQAAVTGSVQLSILYDGWGLGCPDSGAVLVIVTGPSFTVLHANLLIGSIPGAGGTFETHDDTGALFQTGNLSIPRSMHSATLLQNGEVFVAGGTSDATSWQILDHSGNVVSSGLLQDSRMSHAAMLLSNGNVFLAGGAGAPGTWEIHTSTGALVASGALQGNRGSGAQGATLQNGNVWISSGSAPTGIGGTDCTYEIHGPGGNLVTSGSMLNCFPGGTIQVLQNGNIMLLGGDGAPGTYEIRSQTGAFVSTGSLTNAFNHGANSVLLNNGAVFIFGSCQAGASYPDYRDPTQVNANPNDLTFSCGTLGSTSTWETRDQNGNFVGTNSLLNQYDGAGAAVLSNGNVLITGGNLCGGCWEIRSPSGALVSQGSLFDSRGGGHTLTHF